MHISVMNKTNIYYVKYEIHNADVKQYKLCCIRKMQGNTYIHNYTQLVKKEHKKKNEN